MLIDLHTHSTASDGTSPPAEVVRRAAGAGVGVVALTDHDTVSGHDAAAAALPEGLTLIRGAEISCVVDGTEVHLLAYLFDPAEPAFARERELLRTDRVRRAQVIVQRCRALGAPITWEQVAALAGGVVGRPHVAQALADAGVVADVPAAFGDDWIGSRGRAYEPKYALDAEHAVELIRAAGGVAVFAHPRAHRRGRVVADGVVERLAGRGLAGLEVDHPDHDAATRDSLRRLAGDLDLLVTGGSDDHGTRTGHRLGCEGTAVEVLDELIGRATGAAPDHGPTPTWVSPTQPRPPTGDGVGGEV